MKKWTKVIGLGHEEQYEEVFSVCDKCAAYEQLSHDPGSGSYLEPAVCDVCDFCDQQEGVKMKVISYSDNSIVGTNATESLVEASREAPNGMVYAVEENGVWDYVPEQDADNYRKHFGLTPAVVYVEA